VTIETRVFFLGALLGAVSGATVCFVLAYYVFEGHLVFATIVGAVAGAGAGCSGENTTEAVVICVINSVLIWMALAFFSGARAPSSTHEFIVLLIVTGLLGASIGRLAGSFTKGR
jgi:hypothetical protein